MKKLSIAVVLGAFFLLVTIPAQAAYTRNLTKGSTGTDVTMLQQFLTQVGVYTGPITGGYYSLTAAAVSAFQKKQGIAPASGYFGPITRAKVNAIATTTTAIATTTATVATTTAKATTTTTTAAPTPATTGSVQWGVYTGSTVADVTRFESMVGKPTNIHAIFWGWDDVFPTEFSSVGKAGKTLLIFWEPPFNYDHINDGSQDAYIAQFAKTAKAYGYPVILVPFPEPNLGEEVYGDTGSNTPAKFVAAWRRVHDAFVAAGATNVKFGIAYNNESTGTHKNFDDYYPGSAYVDYVGIDGFNFGGQTFRQVFDAAMAKVSAYGKPIYFFSVGSVSGTQRTSFITGLSQMKTTYPSVRAWIWFNADNLKIDTDTAAISAFSKAI